MSTLKSAMKHKIGCIVLNVFFPVLLGARTNLAAQSRETVITLERTTCYGTCPSYELAILGDGTVTFEGRQYVRVKGTAQSKIDPASVELLVQGFISIGYFALEDEYTSIKNPDSTVTLVTDLPTTITSLTLAGKRKRIVDYVGAPEQLMELEDKIDRVVNSKRWVNIDSETVHEKSHHGWNVNGKEARELLVHAAGAGDADVVRAFIQEGANVKGRVNSISLLQIARGKGVFEALISAGANVNGESAGNIYPPLLRAAELGEADSLAVFIRAGAKVDIQSAEGTTALMMAAQSGIPASVKLLLSAGADVSNKDKHGETAIDYARHGEESNAFKEAHPRPFSRPIPEFRARFEEIRKLLAAASQ